MTIVAFLPCRAGSQRVPRKNTRRFADREDGLLGIKLDQLIGCGDIDSIILSTNDPSVIEAAAPYLARAGGRLRIDHRPDHLCSASTSTDEVCSYVPTIIADADVLWTHVTSPFYGSEDYSAAIAAYRAAIAAGTADSLLGVTTIHSFLWGPDGPINYDRSKEKWPRTQTLAPLFEVNSAIFIASTAIYRARQDRIGDKPLLHAISKMKTIDIDWEEDFALAENLWRMREALGA